jgi:hypothetical protein
MVSKPVDWFRIYSLLGVLLSFLSAAVALAAPAKDLWATKPLELKGLEQGAASESPMTIDDFIAAGLAKNHLLPAAPAGKAALLRRAFLDLTGLPPSPEQIGRFLNDERPGAFAEVVEKLLNSPGYGEK